MNDKSGWASLDNNTKQKCKQKLNESGNAEIKNFSLIIFLPVDKLKLKFFQMLSIIWLLLILLLFVPICRSISESPFLNKKRENLKYYASGEPNSN